jgi:addiction module HigA family antidote
LLNKPQPLILCFIGLDATTLLKDADTPHGAPFECLAGLSAGQYAYLLEHAGGKRMKGAGVIRAFSVAEAAKGLGVTRKTLSALLNCRASLSPEMAVKIGKATGTTSESWLYMQAKLDLWLAEQKGTKVGELRSAVA